MNMIIKTNLKRTPVVRLAEWGIVAVAYVITAKIGFAMAIPPGNVTAVWPPSGIALAAMMLLGYRVWPGIWLGSFVANIWSFAGLSAPMPLGVSLATAAGIALGSTLQALIGAYLIQRWIGSTNPFDRTQDIFKFVAIELISCLVAATFGATSLTVGKFVPLSAYPEVWRTWWLGDLVGIIVVTSAVIAWAGPAPRDRQRLTEATVSLVLLLIVGLRVFGGAPRSSGALDPLAYTFIPFIVWAALRFGPRGVTASILIVSATAIWGTAHGSGPFVLGSLNESLIALQSFIAIETVTGLTLMASLREREQAEQEIKSLSESLERRVLERTAQLAEVNAQFQFELVERRRAEEMFRGLLESAPDAMVIVDEEGRIVMANSQVEKEFGYQQKELLNQHVEVMIPDRYQGRHSGHRADFFLQPRVRSMGKGMELYGLHKDGSEFPVEISLSPLETEQGVLVTAAIRDITERKRAEEAMHAAANKVLAIFSSIEDGITVSDPHGRILEVNDAVARLHGFENKEDVLKVGISELVSEEDQERLQNEGLMVLKSGGSRVFEYRLRRKDGSLFDGEIRITRLGDPEMASPAIIGITRDITEHKQVEELLRRQNDYLETLHQVSLDLLSRRNVDDLLDAIINNASRLLDAPYGDLDIVEGDVMIIRAFTANQAVEKGLRTPRGVAGAASWQAYDTRQPVIIDDYANWPQRNPALKHIPKHALIIAPLIAGDHCLGVFSLARAEPGRLFTPDEIRLATLFAEQAALALDNAQLQDSLRQESIRDPLTGLFNRRFMQEVFAQELYKSKRGSYPLAVVMVDLDLFKNINDTFGHDAGDEALRQLGSLLQSKIRGGDIVCRFGGEEFIILLPGVSLNDALQRMEQMRKDIKHLAILYQEKQISQLSGSFGVAVFPQHGATENALLKAADKALYRAKENGRDQIIKAE